MSISLENCQQLVRDFLLLFHDNRAEFVPSGNMWSEYNIAYYCQIDDYLNLNKWAYKYTLNWNPPHQYIILEIQLYTMIDRVIFGSHDYSSHLRGYNPYTAILIEPSLNYKITIDCELTPQENYDLFLMGNL